MQNAADHTAIIHAFLAAHVRGQERFDLLPLLVVQPKQVAFMISAPQAETAETLSDSAIKKFIWSYP